MYAFPSHALRHTARLLALGALVAVRTSADPAPAYLVKDILPAVTSGGRVYGFQPHALGDVAYFNVETTTTGVELWRSDGTTEGTALIRDVWPGVGGEAFTSRVREPGQPVLVTAPDPVHGFELWRTDGTAAGTTLVKDILPGGDDSYPHEVVFMGGVSYFVAFDHEHGHEIWRSDGTAAGTALVKDVIPGRNSSVPQLLTASGSTLFFFADDGVHGDELWKSDGTAAGTVMVLDVRPGAEGSAYQYGDSYLRAYGGGVLFGANDGVHGYELWKSDGTAAGTVLLKDFRPGAEGGGPSNTWPDPDGLLDGKVWFAASDSSDFYQQLWSSDGTTAGTTQLIEIVPNWEASGPGRLVNVAGTGFFILNSMDSGFGLWKTDGSAAGTVLVHDFFTSYEQDYCANYYMSTTPMHAVGLAFYVLVDCFESAVLWRSDGTAAGTFPIATGGSPVVALDDALLFSQGGELWRTDGTLAGTAKVKGFTTHSSSPSGGVEMGGHLYFAAQGPGNAGRELWKSDGTAAGTQMLVDLSQPAQSHSGSSDPESLTVVGNTLFFTADTEYHVGRELWKSDGTAAGTVLVRETSGGWVDGIRAGSPLVVANGQVFFSATNNASGGFELWKSDGTAAGTVLVKDLWPTFFGSHPHWITNVGGTLYFAGNDGTAGLLWDSGVELYKSDGTAAGTVRVEDIWTGPGSSAPSHLVAHAGLLYFSANDGVAGAELWRSDGTAAGTYVVKDIWPGAEGSEPAELISANGALYFRASTAANGSELWKSDGTGPGTVLVRDIEPGSASSEPSVLRAVAGRVAFQAGDGVHGRELWTSDGSEAGTQPIDLRPGSASSLAPIEEWPPRAFTVVDERLVFAADDGVHGEELWVSDGTAAGTQLLADVDALGSSQPGEVVAAGDLVFFSASRQGPGRELFALPRTLQPDSDGDGLDDVLEALHGTNPLVADTDADGLSDGAEVLVHGTAPLDPDTDDDGHSDGYEVNVLGTDPSDPNDPPNIPALGSVAWSALAALLVLAGTIGSAARLRRRT